MYQNKNIFFFSLQKLTCIPPFPRLGYITGTESYCKYMHTVYMCIYKYAHTIYLQELSVPVRYIMIGATDIDITLL